VKAATPTPPTQAVAVMDVQLYFQLSSGVP
jgi:hypothetical protein